VPGLVPLREGSRGTMVGHPTLASATCSEGEAPAPPPQQLIPAHIVADKTTARPIRAECLNISLPVYRPSFLSRLTASTRPTSRQAIARLSRPTAPDPVPGLQRLAFSWSWLCRTASIYLQTSGIGSGMTDRARLSAMSPRPADGGPAERLTRGSIFGLTPLPLGVRAIWVGESERRFWSSW
jgi:hypothetical protein